MDDLVREFIDETLESLGELDVDLVKLEQDPKNEDLLGNIFRLMHTIKGTCGFIGLSRLEKTAHAGENLLDLFRKGTMDVSETSMTLLFKCIDRVRYLVDEVDKTGAEPDGEDSDIITAIEQDILNATGGGLSESNPESDETIPEINHEVVEDMNTDVTTEPSLQIQPESATQKTADPGSSKTETGNEFLRVQMSVLEDLINMVSELVLTRNQLLQMVRMEESSPLNTPLQRLNRIVSDLQDNIMKTRMQPIGNAWSKLPRIVRDLSTETKKKIVLEMEGEDTELDRQVLEMIKDPLTHMIRNSCDHGIEKPEDRTAAGKEEAGTIKLHAYHEGGFIIISIKDDGRGLDPKKIAAKAVESGIIEADAVAHMSEKQILNCIMRPGFSTAEEVTNISGRGVGMDVVRANIEKIGGSIDMESSPGSGTYFTIQIPLTLAIISALIVEIDNLRYAVPQMNIQELVSMNHSEEEIIEYINNKPVLRLRDRIIPLLPSNVLFETDEVEKENKLIAVISTGSSYYGIIVDQIFDTEEVVIKSVSSVLKQADIFSGNTILGDGQVIMILDPAAIARKFNVEKEISQLDLRQAQDRHNKYREESASMLIFKSGDGAMKAVPLAMVSRLQVFPAGEITESADKMVVQFNGNLMQLMFIDPENQTLSETEVTTIVLSDDRSDSALGLVIDHVVDIQDGILDLVTSTKRPGTLGSMILNKQTVDVIDVAHFLTQSQSDWFSSLSHAHTPYVDQHLANMEQKQNVAAANDPTGAIEARITINPNNVPGKSNKQRVLVVDDSTFFRNMLHPILTAAGYDVTLAEDALHAIALHDEGYIFDIILSDIEMPGMDGCEFVEKMRQESAWMDTPFIAVTSHNTPADIEYGYKKGFDQYIGKFNKDELIKSLQEVKTAI